MKEYTKETLVEALKRIRDMGFIKNARRGNVGGIGNTLEDLLGIDENNLPIPNASEWELKCQRRSSASLTTLFHMEPSPRAYRFVPKILLPLYGWSHADAGMRYSEAEMSFRQTISAASRSDRGFGVVVDHAERKVLISFEASHVADRHATWLAAVEARIGLGELNPQPYWGFDDLHHKAGSKLHNCFYIEADVKKIDGDEYYHYVNLYMLQNFSVEGLVSALESGHAFVDFDARTGHNHGTKFRLQQKFLPELYETVVQF